MNALTKTRILRAAAAVLAGATALLACRRDTIQYPTSAYYVAIETDADASAVAGTPAPKIYSMNFYDAASGRLVLHDYIRPAYRPEGLPEGGYANGLTPGEYDIVIYNYDTSTTIVDREEQLSGAYARTDVYGYSQGTPIIKMPDPLYIHSGHVDVPYITTEDGLYIILTEPVPVLERWTVSVGGIRNAENLRGMVIYLSGQCRGLYAETGEPLQEKAILRFAADTQLMTRADGESVTIITGYNTFGRLADGTRCLLTVQAAGPEGSVYYYQEDVTAKIAEAEKKGTNAFSVDADLEINPAQQGGFDPKAEEWDSQTEYIELS